MWTYCPLPPPRHRQPHLTSRSRLPSLLRRLLIWILFPTTKIIVPHLTSSPETLTNTIVKETNDLLRARARHAFYKLTAKKSFNCMSMSAFLVPFAFSEASPFRSEAETCMMSKSWASKIHLSQNRSVPAVHTDKRCFFLRKIPFSIKLSAHLGE